MASIVQKKNRYYVVYLYDTEDGKRKQKWESFRTKDEAKRRKAEIEYRQELGSLVIPKCKTVEELLREYVSLYGKNTWSMSMYESSTGVIKNYINPIIGTMKLSDVTPRVLEKYYMTLLQTKAVVRCTDKQYAKRETPGKRDSFVTPGTVRRVHKLLNSAFTQAMKWELISSLDGKDILVVFPSEGKLCTTVRVLKTPKTESSVRKIFIPKSVAEMLKKLKASQEEMKSILGKDYQKYDLVIATDYGLPIGEAAIRKRFKKLIKDHDLPDVVFHSLRHTSVTYKLKLNGGDIKAVQGDSGHAQVNMVTDVYSHILDEDRKRNAELFEEAFYGKKNLNPQMIDAGAEKMITVPDGVDAETLMKVLGNPEMVALLSSLAKTIQK